MYMQYADALCSVTPSVCCVTGYSTDNDIDTDIDTANVDADTEATCEFYSVNHISYVSCFHDLCAFLT